MQDERLAEWLRQMDLGSEQARMVALLPLIEVAWSDGEVQPSERMRVLEAAEAHDLIQSEADRALLESWLHDAPSAFFLANGRRVYDELARHHEAAVSREGVLALCYAVADAAGGMFGFGAISAAERTAIGHIAELLGVSPDLDWRSILASDT